MDQLFEEQAVLKKLKHYLPSQAPLKDFVHHNTFHCFQEMKFDEALLHGAVIFGYKGSLNIEEFRKLYKNHKIREDILQDRIIRKVGKEQADEWIYKLFHKNYDSSIRGRVGSLRRKWKKIFDVDIHAQVSLKLFHVLNSFLDQGIAIWKFPTRSMPFLEAIRQLEKNSFSSLFQSKLGRTLIADESLSITDLLDRLVADSDLYERYLFDQQFSHPGWSGMVAKVESNPESLLDQRKISLEELIKLELILEIDALENRYKGKWEPLGNKIKVHPVALFEKAAFTEKHVALSIWQEAYEWSYYDEVLAGIQKMQGFSSQKKNKTFQALFCIDDREGSIRRHIENTDQRCETYGTPGHFGLAFFFKPKQGKFYTRVCPGSIDPKHIIQEIGKESKLTKDILFSKYTNHILLAPIATVGLGLLSAFRLLANIFAPSFSPAASSSFKHMDKHSRLTIEHQESSENIDGLQVGYTLDEMVSSVRKVLLSIGLKDDFGKVIYIIGHGGSSINNTHYAGYDCGACSGRPGSVNARVFCYMANHANVRKKLSEAGMHIANDTQFIGGMHDTTRDEFVFFDEEFLSIQNQRFHNENLVTFNKALAINAKERSRRFFSVNSEQSPKKILEEVQHRSVSLFEPRPELNHATNALCIVGRHSMHEGLFLDRRAFSNSYDYRCDPSGDLLLDILNAAAPVCGGINLEYYFSRVDNQKLGAGSKLPHNVMGLIGVSNGIEGDLRTGLPLQMIEVHDPIRLMLIVEQFPDVVLDVIKRNPATYQWFENEWVILSVVHPETSDVFEFTNGELVIYKPLKLLLDTIDDVDKLMETETENLPVYLLNKMIWKK